ncbi:MAG TPA: lasso peptide biosynthesis B2 protein [Parvularculaceae bacterium]|nr:lasso peptide biosynthesis B2 protein [Parvularculaceae bacterium]HRX39122.1 lasso peptide biosynthesis B2 protein [Parvularculaceae bacterium]
MTYYLPEHLSFCDCGGRMVFLDLLRDRYFQLSPSLGTALGALMEGRAAPAPEVADLVRRGLIVNDPAMGQPIAPVEATRPARSAIEDGAPNSVSAWRNAPEVAWRLARASAQLRTKPFCAVLKDVRTAREKSRRMRRDLDIQSVQRFAMAFHRAQCLIPIKPVCLPESLALLGFVFSRGALADLVIAVNGPPFQAHCWVQTHDTLLNNPLDHALSFAPIRVV